MLTPSFSQRSVAKRDQKEEQEEGKGELRRAMCYSMFIAGMYDDSVSIMMTVSTAPPKTMTDHVKAAECPRFGW